MKEEIRFDEIPEGAVLVDIRDSYSFSFGAVEGSVNIPEDSLEESIARYPAGTDFVLICRSGVLSADAARMLRAKGISAASLAGGYVAWLADSLSARDDLSEKALHSLRSTYSYNIMSKAKQAIKEYDMLRPGDKVGVCISGGKDSMLLALIFKELHLHGNIPFEPVYMVMDPGYSRETRAQIEENLRILDIPAVIFNTNIFTAVEKEKSPCTLCAKLRRGALY
ncbi:MAG: ATPase, partial [Oscillospiraceae bacterium]|nr:ATPase [Oscillospiraceae bacterium]